VVKSKKSFEGRPFGHEAVIGISVRYLLTILIAGLSWLAPAVGAAQPVQRDWIGELHIGDRNALVELKLQAERSSSAGTISYPMSDGKALALSAFSTERGRVSFAWSEDTGKWIFEGKVSNGILTGDVRGGIAAGTLELAPVMHLDHDAEERIVGYYELSPGRMLSITSFPVGPVYVDYASGQAGVLFPSSESEFFGGPGFQVPVPIKIRARFGVDSGGRVNGVRWEDGNGAPQIGRKLGLKREEVVFKNGNVVLSGTLVLPSDGVQHPAIVSIHGSGPQTRRNVVDGWYAYHGIAYLSFDKRGVGKSTGDWREAGLSELADDVLAGVRFLHGRSDIDGNQISIEGDSEGGWVAPVVASRDPKLRSVILVAGPALDYVSEVLNEVEEGLRARGLGGVDLSNAIEFKRQALAMLKNGAGLNDEAWERFQTFVRPYRREVWFRYVAEPENRTWAQKKLYLMSQVDTVELWRQITIPVLALYGGQDLNVPAEKNVIALDAALKSAGNRDYTIRVFPNANHDGLDAGKAPLTYDQFRHLQRYAAGYFSTQLDWVLHHVESPGHRDRVAQTSASGTISSYQAIARIDSPIPASEFQVRRRRALEKCGDGIILLHSNSGLKHWDEFGFHQDASFYYFTGLANLHGAILALDGEAKQALLFASGAAGPTGSDLHGFDRLSLTPGKAAESDLNVDRVQVWDDFIAFIDARRAANPKLVFYVDSGGQTGGMLGVASNPKGLIPVENPYLLWKTALQTRWPDAVIRDAWPILDEIRSVKSAAEIALLHKAASATAEGFWAGVRAISPGRTERQVEADVIRGCMNAGSDGPSLWPWIRSGPNALGARLFLAFSDYHNLNRVMKAGEVVRVDLGCDFALYKGDFGRTIPVSGHFDEGQRETLDLVTGAYLAGVSVMREGATREDVFKASAAYLAEHQPRLKTQLAREAAASALKQRPWILHGLGVDMAEGAPKVLQAGNVVCYEPLLAAGDQAFFVEDTILITKDGHEILNPPLPYFAADIEKALSHRTRQNRK
jgi:Xaa-Pro aminopeptidase/pimeloyl-ACP methyl ester carboxylesterase